MCVCVCECVRERETEFVCEGFSSDQMPGFAVGEAG